MKFKLKSPVAILGYGNEGRYAYQFLRKNKIYDITICDHKDHLLLPKGVKRRFGPNAFDDLSAFKTIIRSPGVHYQLPGIQKAHRRVTSLTALTLEAAAERLTAITGSNGKTTTTGLTAEILRAHYKNRLIVGGNDRVPIVSEVTAHPDYPVLMEVSSFQFADLRLSPHISAVLNISPNHLDWHENLEDYIKSKENLLRHQNPEDWAVLNANDENSSRLAGATPGRVFWIGKQKGGQWAVWNGPWLTVRYAGKASRIISRNSITLKTHPDNFLFAAAIGVLHGVSPKTIAKAFQSFKPIPQRLEFVRTVNGISFYNDSSCTTPESAMVAMECFDPTKLILMLGGSSKKADFSFFAAKLIQKGMRVYLYGLEGARIKQALESADGPSLILAYNTSKNFKHVIQDAFAKARPGDSIVLSPACASFDMFPNSKERGHQFNDIVMNLK